MDSDLDSSLTERLLMRLLHGYKCEQTQNQANGGGNLNQDIRYRSVGGFLLIIPADEISGFSTYFFSTCRVTNPANTKDESPQELRIGGLPVDFTAPLSIDNWLFNSPRTLSTKAIQARPNSQAKLLRLPSLRNRRASQHCTAAVIGIISPKSHPCTLVPQKMFDNRSSSRFSFRLDTRIPEKEALNMKFF
ncbi:hypothetical protein PGT21_015119 [Puccinia graminis f. sp. tritici]|uniref:Uncharacterized protein n=1 Tax=Puccinia graminis f. sp. tritici TaxID=56615 RepID=A0A5B0R0S0_PUCGR|nr:hypothetical protein PGT21_015119 [Puccinia graminis f. sp. tritici]KAA1122552.1 hypothetical protein PGTUg99_037783 [Puccinia graminis f. sp. tritici]